MKKRRPSEEGAARRRNRRRQPLSDSRVTELLKTCLVKVCELQAELARDADAERDAEAAGYAACAMETVRFLAAQGLAPDHPVMKGLAHNLLGHDV